MGEDIHQIFYNNKLKTQKKTECKKINKSSKHKHPKQQ